MGCSEGLARIFVFITNFAFVLVGLALLVVGILFKVNFTKLSDAIPADAHALQHIPVAAIVVGSIIFVIAFLGCCGTLRSNTCMLSWYGGILIVIFLVQVALGIYAFVQIKDEDSLRSHIQDAVTEIFSKYPKTEDSVNVIQETFKCCGTNSPNSWLPLQIPKSCYGPNEDKPYQIGCVQTLSDYIVGSIKTIAIVAIAVSAIEVVGAVLALCLTGCIRENRRQGAYY
ncbi:23 kDa integral membrane protein-like [Euwallacea fornicatus]|uniref:23 kDa integral membrane protein-like n=1 Tax=Euwallacea fornicatus TaxID=995702 RepID=UPI00338E4A96